MPEVTLVPKDSLNTVMFEVQVDGKDAGLIYRPIRERSWYSFGCVKLGISEKKFSKKADAIAEVLANYAEEQKRDAEFAKFPGLGHQLWPYFRENHPEVLGMQWEPYAADTIVVYARRAFPGNANVSGKRSEPLKYLFTVSQVEDKWFFTWQGVEADREG